MRNGKSRLGRSDGGGMKKSGLPGRIGARASRVARIRGQCKPRDCGSSGCVGCCGGLILTLKDDLDADGGALDELLNGLGARGFVGANGALVDKDNVETFRGLELHLVKLASKGFLTGNVLPYSEISAPTFAEDMDTPAKLRTFTDVSRGPDGQQYHYLIFCQEHAGGVTGLGPGVGANGPGTSPADLPAIDHHQSIEGLTAPATLVFKDALKPAP